MVRVNKKSLPFYSERKGLRFLTITAAIAVLVVIAVFWWLKLTGITMSNEAFCGHTAHSVVCSNNNIFIRVCVKCAADLCGDLVHKFVLLCND